MDTGRVRLLPLLIGFFVGVILTAGYFALSNRVRPAAIVIEPPPPTGEPLPTPTPQPISVYVNGAVNVPGVYTVSADSRVEQAIAAAGGLSADAFTEGVNLAFPLFDGAQVYVLTQAQVAESTDDIVADLALSGGTGLGISGGDDSSSESGALININTATKEELETIPGVGPSTAESILAYREDEGSFGQIEDIMNVSGIGEGKFEQMREFITVDG